MGALGASQLPQPETQIQVDGQLVTVVRTRAFEDSAELVVEGVDGELKRVDLSYAALAEAMVPSNDGRGDPERGLAGLWARWMQYAVPRIRSAVLATRPLQPYAHQDEAVFTHMLAQPRLRFLLADEPGTGKTIMTGMYLAEGARRGLIPGSTVIVVPRHLVEKWRRDLYRHFAIEARQLTPELARDPADLDPRYKVWVVSLDLFTRNSDVRRRVAGAEASWSLAVFDEAHRLTPTSQYLGAAQDLASRTHHLLLLTATPHRGKEHFFRALLNLLDPDLYPWDADQKQGYERPLKPSNLSFLRRMKEDLRDLDGQSLFPQRFSETVEVALSSVELKVYQEVLDYVDTFYADNPTLPRFVYGRLAASSMTAVQQTLQRRADVLRQSAQARTGNLETAGFDVTATVEDDDEWENAENSVVTAQAKDKKKELSRVDQILSTLRLGLTDDFQPAKWERLQGFLAHHEVSPGSGQLLVFTEFTPTARRLVKLFRQAGYSAEVLEGSLNHEERDKLQQRFLSGKFQVLVSTDAGGEGIDLQSAHVMVDWDIPWSLVRLEQRMGRLHRIGQQNSVFIYHLVSPQTREGRVQQVLLDNLSTASKSLSGRIFDLLDATAERLGFNYTRAILAAQVNSTASDSVSASVPEAAALQESATELESEERRLSTQPNTSAAAARLREDRLEAINPVIVNAFVDRLAAAANWQLSPGPTPGIRRVTASDGVLPDALGGEKQALIAANGSAVRQARADGSVGMDDVYVLGPTEQPFTELVALASQYGEPELARGVRLVDTSSRNRYDLLLYAAEVEVNDEVGKRDSKPTPLLVRSSGAAPFLASWEMLLGLTADTSNTPASPPSPGARKDAENVACRALDEQVTHERDARQEWVTRVRQQLDDVRIRYRNDMGNLDPTVRRERMREFDQLVGERVAQLDEFASVRAWSPRPVGWAEVQADAQPPELGYDPNSEDVAIHMVWAELERFGFEIDDRQNAGLGYDLLARHRSTDEKRLVEVKACLHGLVAVCMEQNEWAQAQQRGADYWLYVVTHCAQEPIVAVRAPDPAGQAGPGVRQIQRYRISVEELRRMAEREQA